MVRLGGLNQLSTQRVAHSTKDDEESKREKTEGDDARRPRLLRMPSRLGGHQTAELKVCLSYSEVLIFMLKHGKALLHDVFGSTKHVGPPAPPCAPLRSLRALPPARWIVRANGRAVDRPQALRALRCESLGAATQGNRRSLVGGWVVGSLEGRHLRRTAKKLPGATWASLRRSDRTLHSDSGQRAEQKNTVLAYCF